MGLRPHSHCNCAFVVRICCCLFAEHVVCVFTPEFLLNQVFLHLHTERLSGK